MSAPQPSWERLAEAARRHAAPAASATSAAWTATVATQAMKGAALGKPSGWTVVRSWLTTWKVGGPLLALLLTGGVWVFQPGPSKEVRSERWADATLRQLKAWHPMECEEAGAIGQLLQRRAAELKAGTNVDLILEAARAEIVPLLAPTEREAFIAEQARLRARWFQR